MTDRKLAFFLPNLAGGGAERVVVNLALGCVEKDYSVDLVLVSRVGEYLSQLDRRIKVVDLDARRVATCIPALAKYLKTEQPAAMLSTIAHANVVAVLSGMLSRCDTRIVVRETHSLLNDYVSDSLSLNRKAADQMTGAMYRRADMVIAVSKEMKPQLVSSRRLQPEKVTVIYNPINIEEIKKKAREKPCHPWLERGEGSVIISIGRFQKEKDFPTLINAFAKLRERIDARLVILGDGDERENLESLVKQLGLSAAVDMPGFVENPYSYLSRASIFVLSSVSEGLPNALLEALALKVPIVSTDCVTGPREILREGKDGILVPVRDPVALANSMELQIRSPKEIQDWDLSVKRFELKSVTRQYLRAMIPRST